MSPDTLAAIASTALEVPSRQADRLIAINANKAAAQRLVTSFKRIDSVTTRSIPNGAASSRTFDIPAVKATG
jgi:16S rRNA G966 N2-methylase RsmD